MHDYPVHSEMEMVARISIAAATISETNVSQQAWVGNDLLKKSFSRPAFFFLVFSKSSFSKIGDPFLSHQPI
ncbi:hypothetical protein TNCV_1600861 [Trichonephila clavipes]|nr:hypothetical protein TNCV_1600861 [Trichonephila clavipes]